MKASEIYNGLNENVGKINRNFKIKVFGIYNGKKINTLVGVSGLIRIIDDMELTNKLIAKAFRCKGDKQVCKLRRGIKVTFYYA